VIIREHLAASMDNGNGITEESSGPIADRFVTASASRRFSLFLWPRFSSLLPPLARSLADLARSEHVDVRA